jgi:hypothetical protein
MGARNATEVIAVVRAGQPSTVGLATVIDRHNALAVKRVNERP